MADLVAEPKAALPERKLDEAIIICRNVNKWFGEFHVLRDILSAPSIAWKSISVDRSSSMASN
jgi:hypothetical protein